MNQLLLLSKQVNPKDDQPPGMFKRNSLQCRRIWGVGIHKKGEPNGGRKKHSESLQKHIL